MAKHDLKKNTLFKKLSALGAALVMTLGVLVPAQATGGIDVSGQAGTFQSSFVNILSAARVSNVITFNTVDAHHYQTGDMINTSGISPIGFELQNAVVTVVDHDTFTVANSDADEVATITGDTIAIKTLKRFAVTTMVGDGTTVTVTTSLPHGFKAGAVVDLDVSYINWTGTQPNNEVVATVPTATTFTFASTHQSTFVDGAVVANLMGLNFEVNEFIDFRAVFVDGATPINARVKFVDQAGLEGTSGTLGQMDNLQDPQADLGENNFLNSDIDFATGAGDNYAELEVEFYAGNPALRTVVTLENLYASVYDIDSSQYVEFSDFNSYFLSSPSDIDVSARGSSSTRFIDGENASSDDPESFTTNRVTVLFDTVSSFNYRIGKDRTGLSANASSAFYQLDLSPGWDVGGAWSAVRAPAVTSPLLASAPVAPIPTPTPYSGPLPERLDITCLAAGVTGTATLTGERLNTITGATVDGKAITLSAITATSVRLALPALASGTYDVFYSSANGSITHLRSLQVCAASTPAPAETVVTEVATKPFSVAKRFSNYRGDRGPVVANDRAAITKFIMSNPGLTHVTCVGSTSGRPAVTTDRALAMARAKNACSVVESLVPGVKTRLVTSTGRGVGQFFRAVTLFGKGEKAD